MGNIYNDQLPPVKLSGYLDIWMTDAKTGEVVETRHVENDIVDAGEIWIAELLAGEYVGGSTMSYSAGELGYGLQYVHVGTDNTAVSQNDYNLATGAITTNYYAALSNDVSGTTNNIIVCTGTFTTDHGNGALYEAGLFSSITAPGSETSESYRMFNRTTFDAINKDTSFQLTLQWTITIGSLTA